MRPNRDEHCNFKDLDLNGKCIAYCIYNVESRYHFDCMGIRHEGATTVATHEAPVDGSNTAN